MILNLKHIELSFINSSREVFNLLNGVDLAVPKGKITALVGGNGTGKTTLFNVISGFQRDYKGKVVFEGKDIAGKSAHKIARLGIGRLFQGRQLMGDLTILENMMVASESRAGESPFTLLFHPEKITRKEEEKKNKAIQIFKDLFGEDCKYLEMLDFKASDLSYGEQRLIAIARLLMNAETKLLLLDEPTAGVNPVYIETIRNMIRKMVKECGLSVLLIEHNMHFVREIADCCAYLDDGVIEKFGTTSQVLDDKEVRNSYLGL